MDISDTICFRGEVSPSFVNVVTGETIPWERRHNTISYQATRAIAAAMGGDASLVPNRIGIVFGSNPLDTSIGRTQKWDDLVAEINGKDDDDIQIQAFSSTPTLEKIVKDSDTDAFGYGITFHVHTDSATAGTVREMSFSSQKIYQAVLLHGYSDGTYDILARVDLRDDKYVSSDGTSTNYRDKPKAFELALDWTVKFF